MISSIFTALIITIIIAFIIENLKLNFQIRRIYYVNMKIKNTLQKILKGKREFDIFLINDLRKVFDKELVKENMIDKYELYKVSDMKIRIVYSIGLIFQELEVTSRNGRIQLDEKVLNYGNDK